MTKNNIFSSVTLNHFIVGSGIPPAGQISVMVSFVITSGVATISDPSIVGGTRKT